PSGPSPGGQSLGSLGSFPREPALCSEARLPFPSGADARLGHSGEVLPLDVSPIDRLGLALPLGARRRRTSVAQAGHERPG
ncbi:hypothetical protein, partial [Streptomyces sp. DT17]